MKLSILLVARNEERYIADCLNSIFSQVSSELKRAGVEFILVDGCSEDDTVKIAEDMLRDSGFIYRIFNNPDLTLSPGWNIALKNSVGDYVVRPDVHSILLPGYFERGIAILEKNSEITAVGGCLDTMAKNFIGSLNALALSSKIGVGNSSFRTNAKDGFYETCVFGIYRRSIFEEVGYFDLALVRHEDNDMHERILFSGGLLYMCSSMKAVYYCRDTYGGLAKQMFRNGFHMFKMPIYKLKSMRSRHYAPIFLVSFFVLVSLIEIKYFIFLFGSYILTLASTSAILALIEKNYKYFFIFPSVLICHWSYGFGQFASIAINISYFIKSLIFKGEK
ncbi:glycosyltransferase [Limnohabitans sp. WS1]|uniref:glycosyltransferase n=1 Tax=Limnohabitans sp. WS1 TaxID=1100726 RepID=UPI000D3A16E3|nr:glycosyltransferase [Limnohabitans sp. WS1]PUE05936.1 hypothetical protein B9Z48_21165 [Limnohabitans sp. WS1]